MKPELVTGATGFLGWHVARLLLNQGVRVRALVRPSSALRDLEGAEPVSGDLRDEASLARAVQGCSTVYHVAADYRLWARRPQELYASNVDGTRNLLAQAERAGVERFVYTSTVGCIGIPPGGTGDETCPVSLGDMQGAYKRSKFLAEQAALAAARRGFPVVIVNPTTPVGERDRKPTPTGRIITDFLNRRMPAYVDTGLNFVDVRDAAAGHIAACRLGVPGDRYILGAENLTLKQLFEKLSSASGIPAPPTRIPYALAYAAGLCSTAWAAVTGVEPRAPLDGVRMARKKVFVSHARAAGDLGFQPAPVDEAIGRAVAWFRGNGYC